jgi:hypothetical protein
VLAAFAAFAGLAAVAAPGVASADATSDARATATLMAAIPADGTVDVVVIDQPAAPNAPRVRAATAVAASPAAVKAVLLDPAHYKAIIPGLVRSESAPAGKAGIHVSWELEVPLFNLSGRLALRELANGVEMTLLEGDLAPGRFTFSFAPRTGGGSALVLDVQLDIANSTWLLRRIMSRSPVGEPAALAAGAYVALRAVALRAERRNEPKAWRPTAAMAPPPVWLPRGRQLGAPALAPLRALGAVGLVARTETQRLGGVALAIAIARPIAAVTPRLHDPRSWRSFPGWSRVEPVPGAYGEGAEVGDSLPLVEFDATWTAEPGPLPRWTASAGTIRGARMGWEIFPATGGGTDAVLLLHPRLETTGRLARRSIASEPLLEHGTSLALAFANAVGMKTALEAEPASATKSATPR